MKTEGDAKPKKGRGMGRVKDEVFKSPKGRMSDFSFDEEVAKAFDDMVDRSVPYYNEIQRMLGELTQAFAKDGSRVYDLGCSTGTTLSLIMKGFDRDVELVGVDSSAPMLKECREKLEPLIAGRPLRLIEADLSKPFEIENASVVLLVLTLQFVRPLYRPPLLKAIYEGLIPGGALLLVEKVLCPDPDLNRMFIRFYYDYKRRMGYDELEIAQKREALENVLIPYTPQENRRLLQDAGFSNVETFFRWYNFMGFMAVK